MKFEKPKNAAQVGEGAYKKVFTSSSENPERTWAEFKHSYTPEQAKSVYYLNNIVHLLFPDHTVKIHQSGVDKQGTPYIVSDFVSHEADKAHQAIQADAINNDGRPNLDSSAFGRRSLVMETSDTIDAFIERCEAAGLRENFAAIHTWGPQDVIFDENGNFKFVDVDPAWEEPDDIGKDEYSSDCLRFDPVKLQAAIHKLDADKQKEAQILYDRLIDLCRSVGFAI